MTLASPDLADHTARRDARWRVVTAEHGVASLLHTHWLDDEFRAYAGAPGRWARRDGRAVGRDLAQDAGADSAEVALAPGQDAIVGRLRLRAIDRDGALALRVFDPDAPGRVGLRGILSFPRTDRWVIPGRFVPAATGERRLVRTVDGYEREEPAVGIIALEIDGKPVRLTVSGGLDGFSAVIADGTSDHDAYRFRFLPVDRPDADGRVIVDFNRAYLPPCAFSDQYVCPLPPAGNRLAVRIEAGERIADREPVLTDTY